MSLNARQLFTLFRRSRLDTVFGANPFRDAHRTGRLQRNHHIVKPTVAATLGSRQMIDFKTHPQADERKILDPAADNETVAEIQGPLEIHLRGGNEPAVALFLKLNHRHTVAALHLVEPRSQHIIQISAAMHMLIHVDVIRPHLQLRFKFGINQRNSMGLFANSGSLRLVDHAILEQDGAQRVKRKSAEAENPAPSLWDQQRRVSDFLLLKL